ncbi:MAG: hypothetical protein JNL74_12940 [Fibrobacteres bacterium]|nr:hypothetical protein [Fibrobacterota bacterium]
MKIAIASIVVLVTAAASICGQYPAFGGIKLEMSKEQVSAVCDSLSKIYGAQILKDSNTVMVHSSEKLLSKEFAIQSIKCMFNKKKSVQALNITCKVSNVFDVEAIVGALESLFGKYDGKRIPLGFSTELEWNGDKSFKAYLFSSESARETYILLATPSFMKEEEIRGGYKE